MQKRAIGPFQVAPVGLGCMSLNHAYGVPPSADEGARLLGHALDCGYDFLDTATIYGMGANERLIGSTLGDRRDQFVLASKCGLYIDQDGKRVITGRPDAVLRMLDESLVRLGTDHIDLYYLHRRDFDVPIEETVGALAGAVHAGKIGAIGLSEMSADTLRRAHAVHPIAAMQTEYSLWTRNAEIAVLDACQELGVAFVAFSPVARGFLGGAISADTVYAKGDLRAGMPRFQPPHIGHNLALWRAFEQAAMPIGCTPAQLAIAWVLHRAPHIVAIPGSANAQHIADNYAAANVELDTATMAALDAMINQKTVSGARYPAAMQPTIETEEFV